jgi:hypothetical protein
MPHPLKLKGFGMTKKMKALSARLKSCPDAEIRKQEVFSQQMASRLFKEAWVE